MNGRLASEGDIRVDPTDRGFTLGDGLFETIRAVDGLPAYASRHLARLRAGAELLALKLHAADHVFLDAMVRILEANDLRDAVLRLTVTRGPAARGLLPPDTARPTMLLTAAELPPPQPPARVIVAQTVRRNECSPLARIKSLNYLDNILARQEAARRGADDAILLNTQLYVAEASASTLFVHCDGMWQTPPVADGALPGVMRGVVLESRDVLQMRVPRDALTKVDAAFLANSLGIRQIAAIDGRPLRNDLAYARLELETLL